MNNIEQEFLVKIQQVINLLDDIDKIIDDVPEKQQENDYTISDYLHLLENEEIGTVVAANVGQKLKEIRIERHHWNNLFILSNTYLKYKNKLLAKDQRESLIDEMKRTTSHLGQEYKYRVLDDNAIKDLYKENKVQRFAIKENKKVKRKEITKEWLEEQLKNKSQVDLAKEIGVTPGTIINMKKKFGLEIKKKSKGGE